MMEEQGFHPVYLARECACESVLVCARACCGRRVCKERITMLIDCAMLTSLAQDSDRHMPRHLNRRAKWRMGEATKDLVLRLLPGNGGSACPRPLLFSQHSRLGMGSVHVVGPSTYCKQAVGSGHFVRCGSTCKRCGWASERGLSGSGSNPCKRLKDREWGCRLSRSRAREGETQI